ncbi:unnamed protein product [Oncorhynchus mykiss]|uniref:Uncharacterized protein n=1 Tax=Oncorhynchus mykiss TaxID=8022 RepID=A0A060Y217_ONCMY|nr:unnamed protein product [Oncorhynchus mykiss]
MSPSNPFLSLLQCNPFYEELLADQALNLNSAQPHLPPCCSSFTSYISVAPQTWSTNTNPVPILPPTQDSPVTPDCTNTGMKEQRASLKLPPEEKSANTKDKEEEAVKTSQRPLPPLPKTETVPSANSPLCEEDMSYAKAETASFYSATGPDNIAALDLMGEFSDDRCWATCDDVIRSDTIDRATSHLGATCVVKEKTTSPEARIDWPIGMDLESYNSAELSNALLHSVRSQAHSPLKTVQSTTGTSSGEKVNEDIEDYRSEDQYSEHPRVESVVVQHSLSEEHPLQRSLSEGTRRNSVEDLTLSFGSDPGVVTLGSLSFVQQHDTSDLLAASSFSAPSSLTAERNTSSSPALSSLPAPPPATVRSSVSTVSAATLFSTAQPVIGASHAGLPQETHPPANQQIR